jgi:hypothetical protein
MSALICKPLMLCVAVPVFAQLADQFQVTGFPAVIMIKGPIDLQAGTFIAQFGSKFGAGDCC